MYVILGRLFVSTPRAIDVFSAHALPYFDHGGLEVAKFFKKRLMRQLLDVGGVVVDLRATI